MHQTYMPTWLRCSHCSGAGCGLSCVASSPRLSSSAHKRASASGWVDSRNSVQQMVCAVVCSTNTCVAVLNVCTGVTWLALSAQMYMVTAEVHRTSNRTLSTQSKIQSPLPTTGSLPPTSNPAPHIMPISAMIWSLSSLSPAAYKQHSDTGSRPHNRHPEYAQAAAQTLYGCLCKVAHSSYESRRWAQTAGPPVYASTGYSGCTGPPVLYCALSR